MFRCKKLKIFFSIKILVGLCNLIVANGTLFDDLSIEERKHFFGTEDGSIPQYQIVMVESPPLREKLGPDILLIEFNYFGRNTSTTLTKIEDQELIGRNSTGFWLATSNPNAYHNVSYTPRPDIFDSIGNVEFYMNLEDFSAVTRFWNFSAGFETYTGILMQNYTLKSVPRGFKEGLITVIEQPTVTTITYTPKFVVFENSPEKPTPFVESPTQTEFQPQTSENSSGFSSGFSGDVQPEEDLNNGTKPENSGPIYTPEVVYPKLLLAPSHVMLKNAKSAENLVRELIAHMHTVDMLYRQFQDPKIRLHISGIIIPQDNLSTPYMSPPNHLNRISIQTLYSAERYFDQEQKRFPFHTYDIVVLTTPNSFYHGRDENRTTGITIGAAYSSSVCNRVQRISIGGVAIVKYETGFGGIITMTHELAHAFNASHDGEIGGYATACSSGGPFTMTEDSKPSFTWSPCSKESVGYYFKTKRGSCTHEKPYSVPDDVKHLPSAWLSKIGQCQNQYNGDCDLWST